MPERWRRKLGELGGLEPDAAGLRDRALHGPRLPDPKPGPGRAIVAGAVAIALSVGSFGLLRTTFGDGRNGQDEQTSSPPTPVGAAIDPAAVCDVPEYDPDVALLGDRYDMYIHPSVGPIEVPLDVLQVPGESGSTIAGPGADELRRFLDSGEARYAPSGGWRAIAESDDEVIFAAPPGGGYSDWWIVRLVSKDGAWRFEHTELVDQHQTPAQLGHGLELRWTRPVVLRGGTWNSSLEFSNGRHDSWTIGEDGYELWGHVHVFDPTSGDEVGRAAETIGNWGPPLALDAGSSALLPLSLGGSLEALASDRSYDVVACVPELGLASPVGTLRVEENTVVRTVQVLTYPFGGASMQALGGGRLMVHNGCLAVDQRSPRPIYVLWPDGYAMVEREGEGRVLIDPVGREVARLGDDVSLGGGYVPPDAAENATIGGVPEDCRTSGEGYFLTSGLASAG
jgi:hypothetical protein